MSKSTRDRLTILAILFLGLFLRIYHLSNESIWYDEAYSIKMATSSLHQSLEHIAQYDKHPPLYYLLLRYWINLFGDTEFSTRFLSVIFGFFSIFMIYKVGSLIFDEEVGILSSLILGLSTFHIYYSQEARMYSLMTLLTLLSIYFFVKLIRERSLIASIAYMLSSILLMYTHVYGLFIIIAENIYIVTLFLFSKESRKLNFRIWILLQAILIALFTPWISALSKQVMAIESGFYITKPSILSIIQTFYISSGSKLLLFLFIILSFFSVLTYEKIEGGIDWKDLFKSIESYQLNIRFSNVVRIYLLSVWLLTPIILPFIISKVSGPIYRDKYTIAASLAFYILVAAGIRNIDYKYIKLAIIAIIIVFSLVSVRRYYTTINKQQWREVANYIDSNAKHGDLLLFNGFFTQTPFDYYSKRTDLNKRGFPKGWKDAHVDEENIKELGPTVEGNNRVWVILCYSGDSQGLIKKTLGESYNLSYDNKYFEIEVYLFEKK